MQRIIDKFLTATFLRYITVTIGSYVVLLGATAFFVEVLGYRETWTYVIVLALVYVGVYISSSQFVFKAYEHEKQWYRFLILITFSWAGSSLFFAALVTYTPIHYLLAAVLNILIFGPLRYTLNRNWVFKDGEANRAQ